MALLVLVVLGVLSTGAFTASRQTFRGGRNALVEQRAFAVAEYGLNLRVSQWDGRFNLPAGAGGMNVGGVNDRSVYVASEDTARVRITRLGDMLYHVESVGRASIPNPNLESVRNVAAIVRLAYPTITPRGAVTSNGSVEVGGNSRIDGRDRVPYAGLGTAWSDAECTGLRGSDLPAAVVPPSGRVTVTGAGSIVGGWVRDAVARDSNTYVRFGSETWNTLAASATRFPGGTYNAATPVDSAGNCWVNASGGMNWGEPWRGAGSVPSCRGHYPILYFDGPIRLTGRGRGQGIMLVNGDVDIAGTFDWAGVIIARDDVKGAGTATITGSILARNVVSTGRDGSSEWTGTQDVQYSRCAVESALRGSAILVRARDRSWTQTY
jgi:hypothetical protein